MTETVVDASALIFALTSRVPEAEVLSTWIAQLGTHAPQLIDAECGNYLRSLVRRGEITPNQGYSALHAARTLIDTGTITVLNSRIGHGSCATA